MITRVVIADDHEQVRAAIIALLGDIPGVRLVGVAADGDEAVALVQELKPDLLLLDLVMPRMSGFEALALIREASPDVCVVILSMHNSEEHVLRAIRLGAAGFLLKDSVADDLEQAIKSVTSGNTWFSAGIAKSAISGGASGI